MTLCKKNCYAPIISVLLGVGIGALGAWLLWPDSIKEQLSRYTLLNPSALVISEQDLLVRFEPLRRTMLAQYENNEKFHIGLYFEYLPTGANISVNNNRAMWPASLIKIPVAMAVMKKVERGEWRLDNQLVILDEDKDPSFGSLHLQPTGTTITIEELLHQSLVLSDNTAHFVLLRNVDAEELEEVFVHLGLNEVLDGLKSDPTAEEVDNRMTAKNYSVFFRSLFNATYLSPEYSQIFLNYLTASEFVYARAGLPDGLTYAHKIGVRAEEGVWADSGIIYEPRRPYLLTIMLEQKSGAAVTEDDVAALFKEISSHVYTYVHALN